ncbi:M56 family metallopeptidase [Intestinimonas sp. HCP28S3_D6]|uniref:M56 family metallopeptidase n=1 Tax=Intestinimonas sp. HCP28S3_D6 TaxID=3438942 RepID=UPI003F8C104A
MTGFLLTLLRLSLLGSVLGVVLMGVLHLLGRRISRAAGYYLWLLVLLRLCVPVWVDLSIPAYQSMTTVTGMVVLTNPADGPSVWTAPTAPPSGQGGQSPDSGGGPSVPDGGGETVTAAPAVDWGVVLTSPALWFTVWVLGFVLSLGRYGRSYHRFARLVRRGSHAPGPVALEVLKDLDPSGKIALAVCPDLPCPMALGLLRPTVFLPEGVEDRGRLEDILRHELTHLRRRDLLYKWCAVVVTSLHWFNPLMPAFRREMARRCELSCDEAAAGKLSPEARRRYGETLLSLAAAPPKGLVVTTLCEEKEHLKERLVDLVNGTKRGPAALALTLCAALLLGSCSLIGGTAMVTPGPEVSVPAETQAPNPAPTVAPDALFTDAALYDLGGGLTLAIPTDIVEDTMVLFDEDLGDGSEPVFPRVYHRSSYEAGMEDFDTPMGFLFSFFRYDQVGYEQNYLAVHGGEGQTIFARDGEWYYGMAYPTDVQFFTADGDQDTGSADYQRWEYVRSRIPDIQADFIVRNGLTPYNGAELDRPFLWTGEHRYVEVHSADYAVSLTLLLSQPVTQGSGGIWCVEGSFDNNYGSWSRELPYGIEVTVAEYYADLQAQVDQGHRPGLLDPVQAAREWYQEKYDAETLDGLTFTLLEGEPAGDLGSTIGRLTGQTGTLESLFYLDGDPGSSEGRLAFHDPEFLSGEVRWYLQTFVWMEGQGPETIEGEAVRYQTESGDELLFLEEDGLLRITIGGEVFWYRPAYAYQVSPYDKMLSYCADLAQEEDPFTWEQIDAGMDALSAWLEGQGWGTPLEGYPQYLPLYARYHAQTYLENGKGQGHGLGRTDVLVLFADFSADVSQGEGTYVFWLIPDGAGGWQVDDWGRTAFPDLVG